MFMFHVFFSLEVVWGQIINFIFYVFWEPYYKYYNTDTDRLWFHRYFNIGHNLWWFLHVWAWHAWLGLDQRPGLRLDCHPTWGICSPWWAEVPGLYQTWVSELRLESWKAAKCRLYPPVMIDRTRLGNPSECEDASETSRNIFFHLPGSPPDEIVGGNTLIKHGETWPQNQVWDLI